MYDEKVNIMLLEDLEDKFINNLLSPEIVYFIQNTLPDPKYKPLWDYFTIINSNVMK